MIAEPRPGVNQRRGRRGSRTSMERSRGAVGASEDVLTLDAVAAVAAQRKAEGDLVRT